VARQVPVIRDKAAPEAEAKRGDRFATRCLHPQLHPFGASQFKGSFQFGPQRRLPQVIGQVIGTAQQDGETVTQRFLQKIFLRHCAVLL
jgi:hypothetical protein